jgi:thioredoxin reductase (NADPH)
MPRARARSASPRDLEALDRASASRSGRPVLFVVDLDRSSFDSLFSDLSRRFGNDFEVLGETSSAAGVDRLHELAEVNEPVAVVLVDDAAADVLTHARELHPSAKRVLLVHRDYSTTSPAVQAITLGRADYHIVRPWADEETAYRAISDFLSSWTRGQRPNFEQFRIVADERDPRSLQLRDLLTRFSMTFGFYATDSDRGRQLLADAGMDATPLPVLIRYDGHVIVDPQLPELATAIGVSVKNRLDTCDVAIVGAGPAGLTAAVYAASEGLETVLIEREFSGGQAGTSPLIRNYPGFPHGINGAVLMERTCEQAWLMGAHIVFAQQVVALADHCGDRVVCLLDGTELRARAVVVATGIEWRRLGVPRLEGLVGSGVFYGAAVSESRAMQGQEVFIVGGGNSAGQAALHLARHARFVTILVRGSSLTKSMSSYLIRAIESTSNVAVRYRTEVVDGVGDGSLEQIVLADRATGTVETVTADALFIMIGGEPQTGWLPAEVARDAQGYLITGRDLLADPELGWDQDREPAPLETSMPGVFAAGDVRHGSIKRVASGVGEGATVVRLVHEHLRAGQSERAPT